MIQIKWYRLYSKFSKFLNEFYITYKDKSGELLYETYIKKDENLEILPWIENFKQYGVTSIDPIHIFASFNYWKIPVETRKKRMLLFCELIKSNNIGIDNLLYEIEEADLDIFKYFPHINITYIVSARDNEQQKEVWEFFSLIYNNEQNKRFKELFNKINNDWFGVRLQSATIFMFWINSDYFIPLDKNTYALLQEYEVLNTFPTSFDKYKKLLETNSQNLYRNLTRIAIDKQLKSTLSNKEQQNINSFLQKHYILEDAIQEQKKLEKLKIDLIPNFNFELYFMVDGKVKKIVCENNQITSYTKLEISNKSDNASYPNFQLIAIKALDKQYTKILKPKKLYYFNNNFKIQADRVKFINEKSISIYKTDSINNINISAIVGKNGTGKSTIIELVVMAINNIAKCFEDNNYTIKELEGFFYTIHTNYSLHSLNEQHYQGEWLHKLFHKNDAYQTPIVIEPYRENGNIDVNKLDKLTKQRLLSTLLEPSNSIEYTKEHLKLTNKQYATHLKIVTNVDKINSIVRSMRKEQDRTNKFFSPNFEDSIDEVLSYDENKNILDYFNEYIEVDLPNIYNNISPKKWDKQGNDELANFTEIIGDNWILYNKIAKVYICYKVKSIADTYQTYIEYKSELSNVNFLNLLINDKSHITFKLHQALNFLKYNSIKKINLISIKEISSNIRNIKANNSELKTIELIPPAFFDIDIIMDDDKSFNLLSSGEKQKIYATSSIIYHLQNIESVHRGNSNNIKYKYVNLILDEIELYFHPDMQRTFISDLLNAIEKNGALDNIVGLNIILVTHSPFILSDILKSQTLYLTDDATKEKDFKDTFGANIHTLLDDSFFMENGLMGEYSRTIIENIITDLNKHRNKTKILNELEKNSIKQIISNIGEPFLKKKIFDMYFSLFDENESEIAMLEREKEALIAKIQKLKNDTN